MKRRSFLKDSLMALAVSLVPKVLQPMDLDSFSQEPEYESTYTWSDNYGFGVVKYYGDGRSPIHCPPLLMSYKNETITIEEYYS